MENIDLNADDSIEITSSEMVTLNSVSIAQQYDATYVRLLLEILYKNDNNALLYRTLSGRSRKTNQSDLNDGEAGQHKAISPTKKQKIFTMFRERIINSNIASQEKFTRLQTKNISRLVAIGIGNIRKSKHH